MGLIFKKGVVYGGVTDWGMVNNRPDYGTGLSHEDYTSTEKTKLGALPTATELDTALNGKVDTVTGKQLSTEDYTTTEKTKLGALPDAATLNADLANKANDSVVVKSVNSKTPTNGAVEVTAEDIPADGIGDKSVSGNPITIEDGMASVAKELSVTLEPIQDLHGYESPWIGTDTDKQPYLFRAISESSVQDKGTHELDKLVGGTVAWNQLRNDTFQTTTSDGITTAFSNEEFSITNDSRTENYNSGSTRSDVTPSGCIIPNHKYISVASSKNDTTGVCLAINVNGIIRDQFSINSVFTNGLQSIGALCLRITNEYDFVNVHPIGDVTKFRLNIFDLTQMFGSTIADYIYSLEQSTAGAGVAWFRKLFPAPYYPFSSGELMSVKTSAHITRGFNQWDEEWELGKLNVSTGDLVPSNSDIRSKNYIKVLPNANYSIFSRVANGYIVYFDESYSSIRNDYITSGNANVFTTPANCKYIKFFVATTTYNNDICINLSKATGTPKNGDYVAYDGHSYALDSDLELRGIPKLVNNALVYDGDIYEASGNVQRRYGVVDLGTLTWFYDQNGIRFYASISNAKAPNYVTIIAEGYVTSSVPVGSRDKDKQIAIYGDRVWVTDFAYTTGADLKASLNGKYMVYELATPTTETADPYTSTQVIDPDGTEEYVDTRTVAIPVGHESAYANVCPIEGRTGTEVDRNSKNFANVTADSSSGKRVTGYSNSGGYPRLGGLKAGTYIISVMASSDNSSGESSYDARLWFKKADGNWYKLSSGSLVTADEAGGTVFSWTSSPNILASPVKIISNPFTLPEDVVEVRFGFYKSGHYINYSDLQIEKGSTATAYEPYSKDTASVTFGQTIYGCTHDFVSGKCRSIYGFVPDISAIVTRTHATGSVNKAIVATLPSKTVHSASKRLACSSLAWKRTVDATAHFNNPDDIPVGLYAYYADADTTGYYDNIVYYIIPVDTTPIGSLVYELVEPIELTLTPAQLSLLQGTNILTADGTINLTYLGSMASNVQDEIDEFESGLNNVIGSIAFIENQTAKTSHAVGEYIILNGIFCKVIAAISSGETLSFGTNIMATTIGAELRAIWAEISA